MTNSRGVSWIRSIVAATALVAAGALIVSAPATSRTDRPVSAAPAASVALPGLVELPMPMWWC